MHTKYELHVLQLIYQHDGVWGWLQIDRALALAGTIGVDVSKILAALRNKGLVCANGDVRTAATRYSVTEAGRKIVE